ncbi:MAG: M28 family peptidase [Gemmatimonadales bacterium]
MSRLLDLCALAALVLAALRHALVPPVPRPATAPSADFSADRAMAHVETLAAAPRPTGSAAHDRARAYLVNELQALGLETQLQEALQTGMRYARTGLVRNVVGRLHGTGPGGGRTAVLLVAHYDGVAGSQAAGDDASGVAAILEALRALSAGTPPAHDIIALFTDAEEDGLLGAVAFVQRHPWSRDVGVVINLEARGGGGRSLMFETGPGNLEVVRAFGDHAAHPTASSLFYALYQLLPNDTDFTELKALDVPGLNFAFIGRVAAYHTGLDTPARLDRGSVQHHGEEVLALARHFGAEGPPPHDRGDAAFFSLPFAGLVVWPLAWRWPILAVAAVSLLGSTVAAVRRRLFSGWAPVIGLGLCLLVTLFALAGALGFRLLLGRVLGPEGAIPIPSPVSLTLAPLALGLTLSLLGLRLARQWAAPEGVMAGAAAMWLGLGVLLAAKLPAGFYLFAVPGLAAAVGLVGYAALGSTLARGVAQWAAAATVVLLVVPILALGYLGLGTAGIAVAASAALVALSLFLAAPLVAALDGFRWWVLPAVTLLLTAGLSAWALGGA